MTQNHSTTALPIAEPVTPPMPRWAYGIVNPTMKLILNSPFHGLLSKNLMVLNFRGRKSGKAYSIPVGYTQQGNTLTLFSHAKWAKNFEGGAPVLLRLRGERRHAVARVITDQAVIRAAIERMITGNGEKMATMMGFVAPDADGAPRLQLPRGTSFVAIELT